MNEDLIARLDRYSAERQFHGGITAEAAAFSGHKGAMRK